MKSFFKFITSVAIIFALVIMGCSFFCLSNENKKDIGLEISFTVFIVSSLVFAAIELTEEGAKESIRTDKLEK